MRALNLSWTWFGVLAIVALTGCGTSAENVCKDFCEFSESCNESDLVSLDCSEDGDFMKECVNETEELSGGCRSAMSDLLTCMNDENACFEDSAFVGECGSELGDVAEECDGEFPLE